MNKKLIEKGSDVADSCCQRNNVKKWDKVNITSMKNVLCSIAMSTLLLNLMGMILHQMGFNVALTNMCGCSYFSSINRHLKYKDYFRRYMCV